MRFKEQLKKEFKVKNFKYDKDLPAGVTHVYESFATGAFGIFKNFWFFFVFRIFLIVASWSTLIGSFVTGFDRGEWFIYLTNWSYLLLSLFFLCSFVSMVLVHKSDGYSASENKVESKGLPIHCVITVVLRDIAGTSAFVVTLLYWILLYSDETNLTGVDGWIDISTHGLNSFLFALEFSFSALPCPQLYHVVYVVFYGIIYAILALIWSLANSDSDHPYVYEVLNWVDHPGSAAIYSICVGLLAIPLVFLFIWAWIKLRIKLSSNQGIVKGNLHSDSQADEVDHVTSMEMTSKSQFV